MIGNFKKWSFLSPFLSLSHSIKNEYLKIQFKIMQMITCKGYFLYVSCLHKVWLLKAGYIFIAQVEFLMNRCCLLQHA